MCLIYMNIHIRQLLDQGRRLVARGPAYPFVDLQHAVEFAAKAFHYSRRSPAQVDAVIADAWKLSPTSSGSRKTIAALKYFGLLDEVDANDGRLVRVSDRAYRILVDDPNSQERRQALREAVLSPKAYLLCWNRWGEEMPPSMRSSLIFDDGFIESTVDGFIADYKKSIEYAGLLIEKDDFAPEEPDSREGIVAPNAVRKNDLPATAQLSSPSSAVPTQATDSRNDVFSLSEGTVSLSWPKNLSEESFQDLSDWLDLLKRKIERSVIRKIEG